MYLALKINLEGYKELLGLWVGETEGSKFWLNVLTELKNRGVVDILIACVDGLKGFPDAIETIYPKTQIQLCIVHMVRNSLKHVSWKERKVVARDLRAIYSASSAEAGEQALDTFAETWDERFPQISKSWRVRWQNVIPFFSYPPQIRKVIYTTDAIVKRARCIERRSCDQLSTFLAAAVPFARRRGCQSTTSRRYASSACSPICRSRSRSSLTLYACPRPRWPRRDGIPARSSKALRFFSVNSGRLHA